MSSNDPVSEFLAREQSALADIGDDFVHAPEPTAPNNNLGQNGFLNGGNLTNGGTTDFNAAFIENNQQDPSFFDSDGNQSTNRRTSPTLSNSRSQSIQPEEEPEKIRKWREQQKELIEKKGF